MLLNNNTNGNYTMRQLKLPLEIEKLIDISDPVYTFCEVMDHIDLSRYFVEKGYKTGRPRCDAQKLLKVILFAVTVGGGLWGITGMLFSVPVLSVVYALIKGHVNKSGTKPKITNN